MKGSRRMVIGYDEGTIMIKLGREEPVANMNSSGKIVRAEDNEIQTVDIKVIGADEPLRLEIKTEFTQRSERVKSVDLHPTKPWILTSLYSGSVCIWNYQSRTMVKSFEVTDRAVRSAKFIARKQWIVAGADDVRIRVYNYNTMDEVKVFVAHADYVRCVAVHPTLPYVLSSSDDKLIKLWDWEKGWICTQIFEGHSHYVMQVAFNPKDTNTFASASLDCTIKIWELGSPNPKFTLDGHLKGVNCVDYFTGGDRPYLITGSDDKTAKVWDYQTKACVQTLEGHTHNVTAVCFHLELPIIITGSEDGTVRIWHSTTYMLGNTLNYGLERVWAGYIKGSGRMVIGYDDGMIMIKLDREEPVANTINSGKIIRAKHNKIQTDNIKAVGADHELDYLKLQDEQRLRSNFTLEDLKQATQNFSESLILGRGAYGCVYKGYLGGIYVAIKILNPECMQGVSGFKQEVAILTTFRHPNLLTLIGVCYESSALVYEFLPNGSLEDYLKGVNNTRPLTWQVRTRIMCEICVALSFLHSNKPNIVIHGDLKPDNVLLDANFTSKLGDFGISRIIERSNTKTTLYYSTLAPVGTFQYMDPQFTLTGKLTEKSDVFAFGVIILRLLTGKSTPGFVLEVEEAIEDGTLDKMIDVSAGEWPFDQAKQLAKLGLWCVEIKRTDRPNLSKEVWPILERLRPNV